MSGLGTLLLETLRLAPNASAPEDLRARWTDDRVARQGGAIAPWAAWEGTELWLRARLAELGVEAPPALADPLRAAGRRAAQGYLAIEAEAAAVHQLLTGAGVAVLLIKGLARRAALPARLQATRATSDVDILVPGPAAAVAWDTLRAAGYEPLPLPQGAPSPRGPMWGDSRHHLRPLARAGGAAVEVHVSTSWDLPPDAAWQRLHSTRRTVTWCGLQVDVPSASEMAWHAFTHAKLHTPSAWRLWFWLDGAATLAQSGVDWTVFTDRLGAPDAPPLDAGRRWLGAAADLAGLTLPAALAPPRPYPLERMLEWRLRAFGGGLGRAVRAKLVDEATRAEAGLGFAPLGEQRALPVHIRSRVASVAARIAYAVWGTGRA